MVLSKKELAGLLRVKTTKREAKSIRRRFQWVLDRLKKPYDEERDRARFHCPHCKVELGHFCCGSCRYQAHPRARGLDCPCLSVPFGGVTTKALGMLTVILGNNIVILKPWAWESKRARVVRWARGHVEWAEAVLRGEQHG